MKIAKRTLAAALAVLILVTACALSEGSFSAIVTAQSMNVYRDEAMTQYWGKLSRDTVVMVESYSGGVAAVTSRGRTGYAAVADMAAVSQVSTPATVNRASRVYKKPSKKSKYSKVSKGTQVNVLSVSGSCAKVEKNGCIGYMYVGHLDMSPSSAEETNDLAGNTSANQNTSSQNTQTQPAQTPTTIEEVFASGKYTNEELVYLFGVKIMGLSPAASCGLVANIKYESGFRPTAGGDGGTSYGICQWHGSRKTRLMNYCENNGYDYTTLLGQLYFLQYELKKYYPSVWRYLNNVSDTAEGAYDAAYYFCFNFEGPANRASKATTRGNYAQTVVYGRLAV